MQIGVVFPQTEMGADPADVRTYGQRVEQLGYGHILSYEHVVGADPAVHVGWAGPYSVASTFHEIFVVYGFLAAVTSIELTTGIVILPQRQTVLVAKQAAEVDILSGGRLRLGVGLGWNQVEYEALGKNFHDRGQRLEEQIDLMRRLWTEPSVTFAGKYETVTGAGLAPLPVQRPIPIWIGANVPAALRRAGRLADGWFPQMQPGPELAASKAIVDAAAAEAGRDPKSVGMEARLSWADGGLDAIVEGVEAWEAAGATHVSIGTMDAGLGGIDGHLDALAAAASALGLSPK